MTEDVTRGLALLADEAEPAPIDPHEVITRARTRTRNRRATLATAFATVALIGTLIVARGEPVPSGPATTPPETTKTRADRLDTELRAVLDGVIPAGWTAAPEANDDSLPPFAFECLAPAPDPVPPDAVVIDGKTFTEDLPAPPSCSAYGYYRDAIGVIGLGFWVSDAGVVGVCPPADCVAEVLPDGTEAELKNEFDEHIGEYSQSVGAYRPDGTRIQVRVRWQNGRATAPFTDEQLLAFATAFTF